jgi:phage terminase large subunit GpA-like protein
VQRRPKREGNPWARVWEIGTNEAKDIIYQRLELDNPSANGYQHFPKLGQFSEYYFTMLVAEDSVMKRAGDGKFYRAFSCENGVRNEALDARVGTMAAERIVKPRYVKLAEEMAVSGDRPQLVQTKTEEVAPIEPATQRKPRFVHPLVRRKGSFVQGWK